MTRKPKIMVVEDQMLIAYELVELLEAHNFEVVGPFNSVAEAKAGIKATPPDAALLDINLGGQETSEPLADLLMQMKLPFAFLSGYRSAGRLAQRFDAVNLVRKPAREDKLISLASSLTAQ
ncbi:MAG: response regulator [Roseobacter sp.]